MPEENEPKNEPADGFKAITSQEELNKLIGERIGKVKSQFADYDDLKSKAEKLAEIEEANKTELQKAQEAAKQAAERAEKAEREALRSTVAAEKGVPASALTGSTKEELEKAADDLLAWRGDKKPAPPKPKSLKSGSTGSEEPGSSGKERAAAAVRALRGASN